MDEDQEQGGRGNTFLIFTFKKRILKFCVCSHFRVVILNANFVVIMTGFKAGFYDSKFFEKKTLNIYMRWNLKNLNSSLNPPKPGLI